MAELGIGDAWELKLAESPQQVPALESDGQTGAGELIAASWSVMVMMVCTIALVNVFNSAKLR